MAETGRLVEEKAVRFERVPPGPVEGGEGASLPHAQADRRAVPAL